MQKTKLLVMAFGLVLSLNVNAGWFGNNNGWGNNYYDDNDWPVWTPMYWMEEMSDSWDNNDYYGYNNPYGYGYAPYGQPYAPAPYQQQQQQQAPVPYSALPAPNAPQTQAKAPTK